MFTLTIEIYQFYGNANILTMSFNGDNLFLMFKYYICMRKYKKMFRVDDYVFELFKR